MRFGHGNGCFLVLILLVQGVVFINTQDETPPAVECDPQCKTGDCDALGNCRCTVAVLGQVPYNFHGGKYCDQPSHYCPEDINFWCVDNNNMSTCGVLNGIPTCNCQPGFAGARCEFEGTTCGLGLCYNNATCLNGVSCDCPLAWQGNANCTSATLENLGSSGSGIKWWGGLLITGAVVAALSAAGVLGLKKYNERKEGINRFNELKKSQMRGRAESDDDEYDSDPYEDEVAKRAKTTATAQP